MHCAVIYCISAADCRLLPSAAGRSISPCSRCQGFTYEHALLRERVSNFCATCSAGTTLAAPVAVSKLSTIANFESCVFLANQSPLCSAMRVACCLMTLNMHYSQKKSGANLTRGSHQNLPELRFLSPFGLFVGLVLPALCHAQQLWFHIVFLRPEF